MKADETTDENVLQLWWLRRAERGKNIFKKNTKTSRIGRRDMSSEITTPERDERDDTRRSCVRTIGSDRWKIYIKKKKIKYKRESSARMIIGREERN